MVSESLCSVDATGPHRMENPGWVSCEFSHHCHAESKSLLVNCF